MVSLVLNSRMFAFACLASALTWSGCSRDNAVRQPDKATQVLIEHCQDVLRRPVQVPPSDDRQAELRAVYGEIVRAYRARDVQTLRDWERRLPEVVVGDGGAAFWKEEKPVFRILFETYCLRESLSEYADAESFIRDVESELALVRIWGNSRRVQKDLEKMFGELEARVYGRLVAYRDEFGRRGRADLERVADKFVREWCERIDSDEGYTKTLMDYMIANEMLWGWELIEKMNITWDTVVSGAVQQVTAPLARVGYRPRWLGDYDHVPEPNWKEIKAWCRKGFP